MAQLPCFPIKLVSFDNSNPIHTFSANDQSWQADQDCFIVGTIYYTQSVLGNDDAYVMVGGIKIASVKMKDVGSSQTADFPLGVYCPVKKGQNVIVRSNGYNYIKCYGLKA